MGNTKQFAFSIAVSGTQEDLESLIPKLVNLGYQFNDSLSDCNGITTDNDGDISAYPQVGGFIDSIQVKASNRPLVLALAAACTNDKWQEGEWMIYVPNGGWQEVKKMRGYSVENTHQYRRPTLVEIQHHFRQDSDQDFEAALNKHYQEQKEGKHAAETPPVVKEALTTQLIPFDLEKAKSGEYDVVTRNAQNIDEIFYYKTGDISAMIDGWVYNYDKYGKSTHNISDLFLKPKAKTTYFLYFTPFQQLSDAIRIGSAGSAFGVVAVSTDGTSKLVHEFKTINYNGAA